MSKTVLILTVRTHPGRREELRGLWDRHLRPRAQEDAAQELYLYCDDANDPDTVHIVEAYGDPVAMRSNAAAPWFAEYMRAAAPLLAGPPAMVTAAPRWAKGYAL